MGECLIINRRLANNKLPVLNASYPQNVTIMESASGSATFSVAISADGKPAEYTYQWYVNGSAVSGATGTTYIKSGLTSAATYSVYCAVTNKAGTVTSRVATLTVVSSKPTYTYTGSHQLIDDGNYNWRIKFLTSGTLTVSNIGKTSSIDVFCVGGGGGGNYFVQNRGGGGGGGGGYTKTGSATIAAGSQYSIIIGAGGDGGYCEWHYDSAGNVRFTHAVDGGTTSAFGVSANGGYAGGSQILEDREGATAYYCGGCGGSGGGGSDPNDDYDVGNGGSDGGNGFSGEAIGGIGQGTTTREFGEPTGTLYAGGGAASFYVEGIGNALTRYGGDGGGGNTGCPGATNTGGGGGGDASLSGSGATGKGGSGIVVIRNHR